MQHIHQHMHAQAHQMHQHPHQHQHQHHPHTEPETSTSMPSTSTINSLINAERIPSDQALGLNAQEASILNFLRVDAAEKQRDRRYSLSPFPQFAISVSFIFRFDCSLFILLFIVDSLVRSVANAFAPRKILNYMYVSTPVNVRSFAYSVAVPLAANRI